MNDNRFPVTGRFLQGRLRHAITTREAQLFEKLFDPAEEFPDGTVLIKRGNRVNHSTMLVEGFAVRVIEDDGGAQIVSIHVPGDFMDLHAFPLKRLDHNIVALGPARVAAVTHDKLRLIIDQEPHFARVLWFSTLLDAAIHREWIMKQGQLRAEGRAAHFFAEVWERLAMVGLAEDDGFFAPLKQVDIANICGTTAIHMNRVLRDLREGGVADFRRGRMRAPDKERLHRHGRFKRDYLYGEGELALTGDLD